jgi:16S rRNA G966 N2-methylase RsmD
VRIIGGQWRRSLLPVADRPGLRPTPDRVRETLFNWLGQDLSGWRVVDAFAGSGALGFEAASRGAAEVLLLEQDPALVALLNASRERLKAQTLRVQRADAIAWLRAAPPPRRNWCCWTRRLPPVWPSRPWPPRCGRWCRGLRLPGGRRAAAGRTAPG